jgi:hypothetical protein
MQALQIAHHAGPYLIPLVPNEPEHLTVYRHVRITSDFLDDDNHWVSFLGVKDGLPIRKIMISRPYDAGDWWMTHWFSHTWALIDPAYYDEKIAHNLELAWCSRVSAGAYRDTVRGRRGRDKALRLAISYEREAALEEKRKGYLLAGKFWPEVRW